VGFSSNGADQLELEVPEGVIRAANGQPAYGQVTIVGPSEIVVSAFHGSLVLDNDGELHTIPEGKSYRVTMDLDLDPAAAAAPATPAYRDDGNTTPAKRKRRKLAFFLLFGVIGALASYGIWTELSESSSKN
jgi:hypothetical protein